MKLYQQIALALKTNDRDKAKQLLNDGITLGHESSSNKIVLESEHGEIKFNMIVYPDFINGFSLGWSCAYRNSDKLNQLMPSIKNIFTELLNTDVK